MMAYRDDNMRYEMVWDNDSCIDCLNFDTFEEAKNDAIEMLINWMVEQREDYPVDLKEWNEDQIDDWDYMIYNYSVSVRDKTLYEDDDYEFGEIWSPSYEDEEKIGWMPYDELIKKGIMV